MALLIEGRAEDMMGRNGTGIWVCWCWGVALKSLLRREYPDGGTRQSTGEMGIPSAHPVSYLYSSGLSSWSVHTWSVHHVSVSRGADLSHPAPPMTSRVGLITPWGRCLEPSAPLTSPMTSSIKHVIDGEPYKSGLTGLGMPVL